MTNEPIQNIVDERLEKSPYGSTKTAELNVQFSIDPTFGLTKERYGWYSNLELFNPEHFTEGNGQIEIETSATGSDSAELRSAYPGKYISHTVAEPGLGAQIPAEYLEFDTSGNGTTVSLTHGEITLGLIEVNRNTQTGVNTIAFSFESDGVYVTLRKNNESVRRVPQEDWNIDPLDGTGPSGRTFRPDEGYVYTIPYTWYGQGALNFAVQDVERGEMITVHSINFDGGSATGTPNMPVEVAIQNQGTAQSLGVNIGGMQYAVYGAGNLSDSATGRETSELRQTGNAYIDENVVLTENAVDPFAQPGRPLVAAQRNLTETRSRTSLSVDVVDTFLKIGGDVYVFIFDEWEPDTALTGASFTEPVSRGSTSGPEESKLLTDTQATDYTPTEAVLRSVLYVTGDKQTPSTITGSAQNRLPIDATTVLTAALPPGNNSTFAQPAQITMREGW